MQKQVYPIMPRRRLSPYSFRNKISKYLSANEIIKRIIWLVKENHYLCTAKNKY